MIDELNKYDFPDRKLVPDGYNVKEEVEASDDNILVLIEKINEIIDVVNLLHEPGGKQ